MDNMTKTIINEILDHSDDDYANRIREKEESLSNTKKHCFNIPLAKNTGDLNDMIYGTDDSESENDFYDPYVVTAEYDKNIEEENNQEIEDEFSDYDEDKNITDIEQAIMNYEQNKEIINGYEIPNTEMFGNDQHEEIETIKEEKYPLINIVNRGFDLIIDNYAKPINVKEHMLLNFKKKADSASKEEKITNTHVEESLDDTYEMPALNITQKNLYINDKQFTDSFNQICNELNMERQKSLNIIKEFDDITSAVNESDKVVQALDNKYNEAEEQLKAVEMRSYEIEQRILDVLNTERDRIAGVAREKKDLITSASKRMEENNEKILDYQEKIASTVQKTKEVNMRIAQQEELLKSLGNNILGFNSYNEEEKSRKAM